MMMLNLFTKPNMIQYLIEVSFDKVYDPMPVLANLSS